MKTWSFILTVISTLFISTLTSCTREADQNTDSLQLEKGKVFTTTVDKLRLRSHPNTQSAVLAQLPEGSELVFLKEQTDFTEEITLRGLTYDEPWLKVKYKEKEGWVYQGGLDVAGKPVGNDSINKIATRSDDPWGEAGWLEPEVESDAQSLGYPLSEDDIIGFWKVEMFVIYTDCSSSYEGKKIVERWLINSSSTGITIKVVAKGTGSPSYQGSLRGTELEARYERLNIFGREVYSAKIDLSMESPSILKGTRIVQNSKRKNCMITYEIVAEKD